MKKLPLFCLLLSWSVHGMHNDQKDSPSNSQDEFVRTMVNICAGDIADHSVTNTITLSTTICIIGSDRTQEAFEDRLRQSRLNSIERNMSQNPRFRHKASGERRHGQRVSIYSFAQDDL